MRFDFKVTYLGSPETPFLDQVATYQVRDCVNDEGEVEPTALILKTRNPAALDRFVQATGIEGLRLPYKYGRSMKMKVSRAALLKGASKGFPSNGGKGAITKVEFQADNMDLHRITIPDSDQEF